MIAAKLSHWKVYIGHNGTTERQARVLPPERINNNKCFFSELFFFLLSCLAGIDAAQMHFFPAKKILTSTDAKFQILPWKVMSQSPLRKMCTLSICRL